MRRSALALMVALALAGCTDWSRPDPRVRRRSTAAEPEPPPVAAPPPPAAGPSIAALREGVRALRAGGAAREGALAELERLESAGFDLMERGSAAEQAEAEALLQELGELRVEVVNRQRGG